MSVIYAEKFTWKDLYAIRSRIAVNYPAVRNDYRANAEDAISDKAEAARADVYRSFANAYHGYCFGMTAMQKQHMFINAVAWINHGTPDVTDWVDARWCADIKAALVFKTVPVQALR